MAKEKEAEGTESQEKEKAEKPPKKPGEMSLMKMLIMVGGTVVVLFILLIVVYMLIIKPDLQKMAINGEGDKAKLEEVNKDKDFNPEEIKKEENERFLSTGRITTNPSMSNQFVVVDIGLDFYVNDEQMKEIKKDKPEESPLMLRPLSSVKGAVNNLLGSMTVQELQSVRRDSLQGAINSKLVQVFLSNKMVLKEAILQEFIIQ